MLLCMAEVKGENVCRPLFVARLNATPLSANVRQKSQRQSSACMEFGASLGVTGGASSQRRTEPVDEIVPCSAQPSNLYDSSPRCGGSLLYSAPGSLNKVGFVQDLS